MTMEMTTLMPVHAKVEIGGSSQAKMSSEKVVKKARNDYGVSRVSFPLSIILRHQCWCIKI